MKRKKLTFRVIYRKFTLLLWTAIELLPFYWLLVLPWKTWDDAMNSPFSIPSRFTLENFDTVFEKMDVLEGIRNSFMYAFLVSAFAVLFGLMMAFALVRMRKRSAGFFTKFFKIGLVLPSMCLVSTTFIILRRVNLVGTAWAVIIPLVSLLMVSTSLSFSVWFKNISSEYEEAAAIDGCGPVRCFLQIYIPQLLPAVLLQFTTIFILIWNNYESFKIYALGRVPTPITMMVASFFNTTKVLNWGAIGAALLLSSLPSIIVYIFFNKFLEKAYVGGSSLK